MVGGKGGDVRSVAHNFACVSHGASNYLDNPEFAKSKSQPHSSTLSDSCALQCLSATLAHLPSLLLVIFLSTSEMRVPGRRPKLHCLKPDQPGMLCHWQGWPACY